MTAADRQQFATALAEEMQTQARENGAHPRLVAAGFADYQRYFAIALKVAEQIQGTVGIIEPPQVKLIATIALAALHAVADGLPKPA